MRPRRKFRPTVSELLEDRTPPAIASAAAARATSAAGDITKKLNSMLQGFLGQQSKKPSSIPFPRERDPLHIEVYTPKKPAHVARPHGKLAVVHHRPGR